MNHRQRIAELEAELAEAKQHIRTLLSGIQQANIGARRMMDENTQLRRANFALQLALAQHKGDVRKHAE